LHGNRTFTAVTNSTDDTHLRMSNMQTTQQCPVMHDPHGLTLDQTHQSK